MPNIIANIKANTEKALTPFGYSLRGIILTNHKGDQADIQNIVIDFSITESIYTAALTLRLSVKDVANFIEEFQLIGQETIEIRLGRHEHESPDWTDIKIKFWVTEYPEFGRSTQQNTQIYSITGVTQQAYVSQFKRVSRAVSGLVSDEILKMVQRDCMAERISTFDKTISRFSSALPLMHPLDSAYWMLRRAYDEQFSPFFLYETLIDGVNLRSLTNLISDKVNPIYRTYTDERLYSSDPNTPEDYQQRLTRILDVSSDFKLSKVLPNLSGGAFSSNNMYLDLSTKTIQRQQFNYQKAFDGSQTMNKYSVLSDKFTIPYELPDQQVKISETYDAFTEYVPTNSLAYSTDGSVFNYHSLLTNRAGKINSRIETMDTIVHDLMVAGDFNLSVGKKVIVQIPKSIDPRQFDQSTMKGKFDDLYDRTVSGTYLITSLVHHFSDQYHCKMRVKRDSLTYDLNKS
jgi:hypothetical protein